MRSSQGGRASAYRMTTETAVSAKRLRSKAAMAQRSVTNRVAMPNASVAANHDICQGAGWVAAVNGAAPRGRRGATRESHQSAANQEGAGIQPRAGAFARWTRLLLTRHRAHESDAEIGALVSPTRQTNPAKPRAAEVRDCHRHR